MKKGGSILLQIILILFLTVISQIGGIIYILYCLVLSLLKKKIPYYGHLLLFSCFYLICCLVIVPPIAKYGGRVALPYGSDAMIKPHQIGTVLLNRHYVRPALYQLLEEVSEDMEAKYPDMKISYLDACFPFINQFPLLPHLSHDDGKKIDLAFQYERDGEKTNKNPGWLGYGVYIEPTDKSPSLNRCLSENPIYDGGKYFHFRKYPAYTLDTKRTAAIIRTILSKPSCQKIFIEPHLKTRLGLQHSKIRFHGCHSVRHDDHIHVQIY